MEESDTLLDHFAEVNLITFVIIAITSYVMRHLFDPKRKKLPPGPSGLPLLGYLPFMPSNNEPVLRKLRQRYGKIFSIRLGSQDVVFLSDFEVIRKVTMRPAFNCRPDYSSLSFIMPDSLSYCEYKYMTRLATHSFVSNRGRRGMEGAAEVYLSNPASTWSRDDGNGRVDSGRDR
jgi:hypothetical protein